MNIYLHIYIYIRKEDTSIAWPVAVSGGGVWHRASYALYCSSPRARPPRTEERCALSMLQSQYSKYHWVGDFFGFNGLRRKRANNSKNSDNYNDAGECDVEPDWKRGGTDECTYLVS